MQQPLQITFHDIPASENVEEYIRENIAKLNRFFDRIISCHVTIELTQKSQHQGKLYNVIINLGVPGKELIARFNEDENLYKSFQMALDSIKLQLAEYTQRLHGDVKAHADRLHGEIVRLFDDGFGFISDGDGTEYYFNFTNVVKLKFNDLTIGDKVQFLPDIGTEGPIAHRVSIVSK